MVFERATQKPEPEAARAHDGADGSGGHQAGLLRPGGGGLRAVSEDLAYLRTAIVNVYFYGRPGAGDGEWVLIDTGIFGSARSIREAAEERFGPGARPACIILTHGHFDHVGAVGELAERWDVPVYAHELEMPYLIGRSSYPWPDPSVGGGAMSRLSWLYPRGPIDLGARVRMLPVDGSVPGMPGWRWIHTPGHTAGHVSLFRDPDRTLIAGDAVITTKQESAVAVLTQRPEIHPPPAYYTQDWAAAGASIRQLAALEPRVTATGHGTPVEGPEMLSRLQDLARNFEETAVPEHGRYIDHPAIADESGTVYVPPPVTDWRKSALFVFGAGALTGAALLAGLRRRCTSGAQSDRRVA